MVEWLCVFFLSPAAPNNRNQLQQPFTWTVSPWGNSYPLNQHSLITIELRWQTTRQIIRYILNNSSSIHLLWRCHHSVWCHFMWQLNVMIYGRVAVRLSPVTSNNQNQLQQPFTSFWLPWINWVLFMWLTNLPRLSVLCLSVGSLCWLSLLTLSAAVLAGGIWLDLTDDSIFSTIHSPIM
jgi:hypothetical protein